MFTVDRQRESWYSLQAHEEGRKDAMTTPSEPKQRARVEDRASPNAMDDRLRRLELTMVALADVVAEAFSEDTFSREASQKIRESLKALFEGAR